MSKIQKRNIALITLVLVGIVPFVSHAAVETPQDVIKVVNRLGGWLYSALLALAAVFIIIGAFSFLTAGGDEQKVSKAKQQILYAVVAVVTALLASGIIEIVKQLLDVTE